MCGRVLIRQLGWQCHSGDLIRVALRQRRFLPPITSRALLIWMPGLPAKWRTHRQIHASHRFVRPKLQYDHHTYKQQVDE